MEHKKLPTPNGTSGARADAKDLLVINTNFAENFSLGGRFTELVPIGFGANGLVFSAKDTSCDKKIAIKKIGFQDNVSCRYALREIRMLTRLQHDNIVHIHEILSAAGVGLSVNSSDSCNAGKLHSIFIIQELLDADLHRILQSQRLDAGHVQLLTYQLLRGLKYIHSANVLHRDLKPANLLLNCHDLTLKIGDFGLARVIDPKYSHRGFLSNNVGTYWYRAPELVVTPRDYSSSLDIWSAGCIFAEMLLGHSLFPGINDLDLMCLILDMVTLESEDWDHVMQVMPNKMLKNHPLHARVPLREKLRNIDSKAVDLIEMMLTFDPTKRISAADCLGHPYFEHLACVADEPVALRPLNIETEVDDLSPTTLKHMIISEGCATFGSCGQVNDLGNTLKSVAENAAPSLCSNMTESKQQCLQANLRACENGSSTIAQESNMISYCDHVLQTPVNDATLHKFNMVPSGKYNDKEHLITTGNADVNGFICPNKRVYGIEVDDGDLVANGESLEQNGVEILKLCNSKLLADSVKQPEQAELLSHPSKKKNVEKCEEDEKDQVEISTRKLEEDQEIESLLSQHEASSSKNGGTGTLAARNSVFVEDEEEWGLLEQQLEKEMDIWQWMADVDKERETASLDKCNCLSIDIGAAENQKEFCQPSPKELENHLKEVRKNLKNKQFLNPTQHARGCRCNLCVEECTDMGLGDDNKQMYILDNLGSRTSSKESLLLGARARSPAHGDKFEADSSNSGSDIWCAVMEKDRKNQEHKLKTLGDVLIEHIENSEEDLWRIEDNSNNRFQFGPHADEVEDSPTFENVTRGHYTRDRLNSLEQIRLKRLIDRKNQAAPFHLRCNSNRLHQEINQRLKLVDSSPEEGDLILGAPVLRRYSAEPSAAENSTRSLWVPGIPGPRGHHKGYSIPSSGASNVTELSSHFVFPPPCETNAGGAKPKKTRKQKQKAL